MTAVAEIDVEPLHRRLGVTDGELEAIRERLGGRDPNELELAMFSVMWSEHCSYKSSKPLLRTLPTAGEGVVAGPGENAGVISIGDGLAVAFKIESHNHPSAVEPYQGAATGVGGILRDIFTMGARPIGVLDALRFGDPASARTRHLVAGVVGGVGGYGNCVGVPTVGGELVFDPSYEGNPLVNVMAIGLLEERLLTLAAAPGPGNLVVLFGSTTGRDGIGGASVLASATFGDADTSKRPSVQVGETSDRWLAGASPRTSEGTEPTRTQTHGAA
jgi:phosphoribosylformylglycinamidine synthase